VCPTGVWHSRVADGYYKIAPRDARSPHTRGYVELVAGNLDAARQCFTRSAAGFRELAIPWGVQECADWVGLGRASDRRRRRGGPRVHSGAQGVDRFAAGRHRRRRNLACAAFGRRSRRSHVFGSPRAFVPEVIAPAAEKPPAAVSRAGLCRGGAATARAGHWSCGCGGRIGRAAAASLGASTIRRPAVLLGLGHWVPRPVYRPLPLRTGEGIS
jgi:hypothetical protein